ncbi:MAG: acetylxylan esterase [Planctomycetota bacterium]|nr:MAG: acetylxylan esterase [Planctomycetota bacterium]
MTRRLFRAVFAAIFVSLGAVAPAQDEPPIDTTRGDELVAAYFRRETARLSDAVFDGIETLEDWEAKREEHRRQLLEMLGLDPMPEKTPLDSVVTGTVEHDEFTVENLHFQSRPGLYVTGNLYVPKDRAGPLPAVLYVCGHARVKEDGVSFGNKTHYQHHGGWFARHGYVCLTIDTLQLGEIEGIHHGTYNHDMWWWNARGYTPAGVEAFNCIRAIDLLQSRPEVDGGRIGVTGRSGGGAYSWWIAAIDERITCAVPVAGITSLHNHVVDGCVEGHCDCMYMVNTYGWDFPMVAALVAPRPLLISNTDKDGIFPLDGVVDVYSKVRRIYELYGASEKLGLQITEGPHKDTQELRVHAFVWMNRFLKQDDSPIETPATRLFEPAELKVFEHLPDDERNTEIHEEFVEAAQFEGPPASSAEWETLRNDWRTELREKCFRSWPADVESSEAIAALGMTETAHVTRDGVELTAWRFTSQTPYQLDLYVAHKAGADARQLDLIVLNVLDQKGWESFVQTAGAALPDRFGADEAAHDSEAWTGLAQMLTGNNWGMAWVAPRGVGPTEWSRDERERTHIRRRFMLLGQTADSMRVYDTRRAMQALRAIHGLGEVPLWLQGEREAAAWALYASLFEPEVARLDLWSLPATHRDGPTFLNVMRFLDIPQAVALAGERSRIRIYDADASAWRYPLDTAAQLGWPEKQVVVRALPADMPE